jgi:DivIVA domain-containing protein
MALTPELIEAHEFVTVLRGCDRHQVEEFLREIADEHRRLLEELEEARNRPVAVEGAVSNLPLEEQVGAEVAGILRASRDAAQRAREDAEREAEEIVRQASARAAETTKVAEQELNGARARAAQLEAEAEERGRRHVERAQAGANALLEEAEAKLHAANQEAASVLEQARAAAAASMQEAREFGEEVQEEAMATLARAQQDAEAVRNEMEADRRQFLAMQAEARSKLAGTDAAVRALLRRLDDTAAVFTGDEVVAIEPPVLEEAEPPALTVVSDEHSVASA